MKVRLTTCLRGLCGVLIAGILAGCAESTTVENGYDPLMKMNRSFHSFNKGVDTAILRPISIGYGAAVPATIKHVISNELRFISLPGSLANSLLQGDLKRSGDTAARLFVNATLGGLGALDPATEMNIPEHKEDFGQTLAVWGVPSGAYVELPLLGPSSGRGIIGRIGDIALDPTTYLTGNAVTYYSLGTRGLSFVDTRYRFGDILDEALYENPDSYLTVRNLYLQRRNSAIMNGEVSQEVLPDIYEAEPF